MLRNLKYGLKNLRIFFKVIWNFRPWDYVYTLELFQAGLIELMKCLENGNEIDETRLPKIKNLRRTIDILDNIIKDKYWAIDSYEDYQILQDDEFKELGNILFGEKGLRGWWD